MIRCFVGQEPKDWPRLIEPLLFAVREVPQASLGVSPFEMLFGRKPRGILDLAREQWEGGKEEELKGGALDLGQLRDRLKQISSWAREHLMKAQEQQQRRYDQKVRPRSFKEGDWVLLLLPTSEKKLLAQWQGPFKVIRRVGECNYEIHMPGRKPDHKVFHVNLLKQWKERTEEVAGGEEVEFGPSIPEIKGEEEQVVMGSDLSQLQREQVEEVQKEFGRVFSKRPGHTTLEEHHIQVPKGKVVRLAPRRWPHHLEKVLIQEVEEMLKLGVIEPSRSEWRSYPVMVPKGDGTTRVCLDFRKVNEVSQFDAYPMPRVTELLERLGRAQYLTTIDLTKGYWQIPLTRDSKEYTAFATPLGLFQFTRMPFGLHGAAATFQRLMDKVLRPHEGYASAYIDDIIIFSQSWEQHIKHLRSVLRSLGEAGLTANPRKCRVGMRETQFLGFQVGQGEVKPVKDKVETIMQIKRPQTKKEVQQVLGMMGYYRMFIPNYSSIAAPLTDLTKGPKNGVIEWDQKCELALNRLKTALSRPPVLAAPDFSRTFIVHTDASGRGLGGVLSQEKEGKERPILYMSRKLSSSEQKYSTIEREALAIKWAVNALKYYLLGAPFKLVTDHAPLTWLGRMKETNPRLTRWYLSLQPFAFTVEHRKGTAHANADFLSRQGEEASWQPGDVAPVLPGGECEEGARRSLRRTKEEEQEDDLTY